MDSLEFWNKAESTLEKYINYSIKKYANSYSLAIQEEIKQECFLRCWKVISRNEIKEKGWRSYFQNHINGAVLDYIKAGAGIESNRWKHNLKNKTEIEKSELLSDQVNILDQDAKSMLDVESVAGLFGVHNNQEKGSSIKWDVLSRLASIDDRVKIVALFLQGYTVQEISEKSEVSRERISQLMYEFLDQLDSVYYLHEPFFDQCIYALGLCERFHMNNHNNGFDSDLESVDLFCKDIKIGNKIFGQKRLDISPPMLEMIKLYH